MFMMKAWFSGVVLLLMVVEVSCSTSQPAYEPFKINRAVFLSKVKTIALAPLSVPGNFEDPEQIKDRYESLISLKLRERGFTVILSKEYQAVYKKTMEQMGGVFDPMTGKLDESKGKAVQMYTLRELQRVVRADAILYPQLYPYTVKHVSGVATWDGVSESITGSRVEDGIDRYFAAVRFGAGHGTVTALSLVVLIDDVDAVRMYSNAGGVQLLAHFSGGDFQSITRAELFPSEDYYTKSINLALGPLLNRDQPVDGGKDN
jgi:hypothetical protein